MRTARFIFYLPFQAGDFFFVTCKKWVFARVRPVIQTFFFLGCGPLVLLACNGLRFEWNCVWLWCRVFGGALIPAMLVDDVEQFPAL